jgi:hypothetical protein
MLDKVHMGEFKFVQLVPAASLLIVTCRAVSRTSLGKHVPAAMDTHATIVVLLETVFSTWFVQRGYKEQENN